MTPDELQEIKDDLTNITPGPWNTYWDGQEFCIAPNKPDSHYECIVEWTFAIDPRDSEQKEECDTTDAEFIAKAPERISALVAEVERLQIALDDACSMLPVEECVRIAKQHDNCCCLHDNSCEEVSNMCCDECPNWTSGKRDS